MRANPTSFLLLFGDLVFRFLFWSKLASTESDSRYMNSAHRFVRASRVRYTLTTSRELLLTVAVGLSPTPTLFTMNLNATKRMPNSAK